MILLAPLFHILMTFLELYIYVVWAEIILSWVIAFGAVDTRQRWVMRLSGALASVTEPVLMRIRRYVKPMGGLDFSPMILLFGLYLVQEVLWRMMHHI